MALDSQIKYMWNVVRDSIYSTLEEPPTKGNSTTINLTELAQLLSAIKIQWVAYHDLCAMDQYTKRHVTKVQDFPVLINKPGSWGEHQWENYQQAYWRLTLLFTFLNSNTESN